MIIVLQNCLKFAVFFLLLVRSVCCLFSFLSVSVVFSFPSDRVTILVLAYFRRSTYQVVLLFGYDLSLRWNVMEEWGYPVLGSCLMIAEQSHFNLMNEYILPVCNFILKQILLFCSLTGLLSLKDLTEHIIQKWSKYDQFGDTVWTAEIYSLDKYRSSTAQIWLCWNNS